jgi:hypothetical protein
MMAMTHSLIPNYHHHPTPCSLTPNDHNPAPHFFTPDDHDPPLAHLHTPMMTTTLLNYYTILL